MIRKIITILCISFLAFSHSVLNASAFEANPTRIELENGYYLETVIKISMEKLYGLLLLMENSHIMENQQHVLAQHIVKPIIQQAGN